MEATERFIEVHIGQEHTLGNAMAQLMLEHIYNSSHWKRTSKESPSSYYNRKYNGSYRHYALLNNTGHLIGMVSALHHGSPNTTIVPAVVVAPEFQGRSAIRLVMHHLAEVAQSLDDHQIQLLSTQDGLFEHLAFQHTEANYNYMSAAVGVCLLSHAQFSALEAKFDTIAA